MTTTSKHRAEATDTSRPAIPATRIRALVFGVAALVLLVVGAAAGMLITLLRVDQSAPPGAGSVDVVRVLPVGRVHGVDEQRNSRA